MAFINILNKPFGGTNNLFKATIENAQTHSQTRNSKDLLKSISLIHKRNGFNLNYLYRGKFKLI